MRGVSLEYIAGFFDGDGSVQISKAGQVRVNFTQTNPLPLHAVCKTLGCIKIYSRQQAVHGKFHCARANGRKACRQILAAIQPFVILKQREVEAAIRYIDQPTPRTMRAFKRIQKKRRDTRD